MKNMKRIFALVLALTMVLSLAVTASAASITINNADVAVEGKTFKAYKILDLEIVGEGENAGYVYTIPEGLEDFYATQFGLDKTAGNFDYLVAQKIAEMEANSNGLFAFAAAALDAAKDKIEPASVTGEKGAESVVFTDLAMGYYVIEDEGAEKPISALMLRNADDDVSVTIKADKPTLEKKIDGDTDTDSETSGKVDYNNAAIGDKVPYVLESKVPDMTGYNKYFFVVTDTLSKGLSFNNDVVITLGGEPLTVGEDYTVAVTSNEDGSTTVEIVFNDFIQYKDKTDAAIVITYSANVDDDAVIGVEGNPNEVKLQYSNNPNVTPSGSPDNENKPGENDPVGETPKDVTVTYTTDLVIEKVDAAGNRLEGAEFTLKGEKLNKVWIKQDVYTEAADGTYWKLTDGTYTEQDPNGTIDGEAVDKTKYESTTVKYKLETKEEIVTVAEKVTQTVTVGSDGVVRFEGLSAGTYTITEITAPDGYNLLTAPITVTIGFTAPTGDPVDGNYDCTWTYTGTTNGNTVQIVNQAGTELPETGGMGTTLFYIFGGILVLAAVVLLVTKKRMASAE